MRNLLLAAAALAVITAPAFSQTNMQALGKPLVFAQAKESVITHKPVRVSKKTKKPLTKGSATGCTAGTEVIAPDGELIGCDPDPTIRLQLLKEYSED